MTNAIQNNDTEQLKALINDCKRFLSKMRVQDSKYADRYYYTHIIDSELTEKISKAYSYWKGLAHKVSNNEYTILRESTVSHDYDDENTFVIAEIAKINI